MLRSASPLPYGCGEGLAMHGLISGGQVHQDFFDILVSPGKCIIFWCGVILWRR